MHGGEQVEAGIGHPPTVSRSRARVNAGLPMAGSANGALPRAA
ncbi:hypothetical protein C731_1983 [Mycolicibacterium hassiacum DSM 44199]|uniref:Uncharacterized protein n=1 Tax=Mycolicibacterium hassiacum (strain DSM 44199 / CIP 105218 / JCM 12690 / 3849) TaxID=1122247 RepID=K5BBH7_MYCHD|nr:hypothetical protein C731_1983 [Mycolicibacterium hassiacum DSM 44199]